MNSIKPLSCLLAIFFSAASLAQVTITIPDNINLLVVNGEKPNLSGSIFSATKTLTLDNGQQQIVFRYHPYFTQGKDRIQVDSEAVIATFTAKDTTLSFNTPSYRNPHEAQQQINNISWSFSDSYGQQITMTQDHLIKPGMQIGRDYRQEVREYNRQGGIAALNEVNSIALSNDTKPSQDASSLTDTTAEEMLHFWYKKADAETQARFKQFINQ